MVRSLILCMFLGCTQYVLMAQITVTGKVLDEISGQPLPGVRIQTDVPDAAVSDHQGRFQIRHRDAREIVLRLDFQGQQTIHQAVAGDEPVVDLGDIFLVASGNSIADRELPTIVLEDGDNREDANISGLLQSGVDFFGRLTNYTFSPARFKRRGLESGYSEGFLNHLPVNDLESGGVYWSSWGGLNDVMRQDAEIIGASMAEWGFGGAGSTFNTDLSASAQWRQKRISYSITNRNYRNRIMGTWSTGMLPSGWAVSLSGSRRWADEGYIPGTFYDAWSYFVSVDRKINEKHLLNLVWLGSPYIRGGSSASTREMYDLAKDHYYNSYWGYQQGKKRSSRFYSGHQPFLMAKHRFQINSKWDITTALGWQKGRSGVGALDWLNANDPRPDYYRRLPSYVSDSLLADDMTALLSANPELLQVQWDKLYAVNLNSEFTVNNVDGIEGNVRNGALSRYVMEVRRSDLDKKTGNIVLNYQPNHASNISFGLNIMIQNTHHYKLLEDLLGGEFYLDWDKFAAQDFPGNEAAQQNDLRRPNRIVLEGDQFGYDYFARIRQQNAWVAYSLNSRRWELSVSASGKRHVYWREGLTQNGKFPDDSFGQSAKNSFFLPAGKGSIRYKLDGRNYITASGLMSATAPTFRNAYVSPRTRNHVVNGLKKEQVQLGEIRYDLRSPYLKISLAGYYLTTKNGIASTSFYHDDERTFVNFTLTGIDKEHKGIEAAMEYKISAGLALQGAAAVGQHVYTSRPNATITQDNDGSILQQDVTVYARNLYISGTPQSAYTGGLTYRSKKFWAVFLNINRFEESWINFNPLRRTLAAVDLVEAGSPQWNEILQQEKVDGAWTVDLSFFKSWMVNWPKDRTIFSLNLGITNLLNNTDYISGGYEQYRFDFETRDVSRFPSRYSFMQGANYFIQASLRL